MRSTLVQINVVVVVVVVDDELLDVVVVISLFLLLMHFLRIIIFSSIDREIFFLPRRVSESAFDLIHSSIELFTVNIIMIGLLVIIAVWDLP
jgi:hypothetical protein